MLAQVVTWAKLPLSIHLGLTCWKIAIRIDQFFKTSMSLDDLANFFIKNEKKKKKKKLDVIFNSAVYPKKKKKKKKKKKTGWKTYLVRICQGVYCTHFVKFLLLVQSN